MKFKIKDLFRANVNVAHIFLTCVTNEVIEKIKSQENYNTETTEVDMKLYIEDTEVDINKFFDNLMKYYETHIKEEATKLVKANLSEKATEISWLLSEIQTKLEYLEENISWDEKLLK